MFHRHMLCALYHDCSFFITQMKEAQALDDEDYMWGRLSAKRLKRFNQTDKDKIRGYMDKCFTDFLTGQWSPPYYPETQEQFEQREKRKEANNVFAHANRVIDTEMSSVQHRNDLGSMQNPSMQNPPMLRANPPPPPCAPPGIRTPSQIIPTGAETGTQSQYDSSCSQPYETPHLPSASMYRGRPVGKGLPVLHFASSLYD